MKYSELAFEKSNYQLSNLWEFSISQNDKSQWPLITYVRTTSIPQMKLNTETRSNGEKHYIGFEAYGDISMTFVENTGFDTYNYFKNWMEQVFNEREGTFVSLDPLVQKGSPQDTIHRQGLLVFNTFIPSTLDVVRLIYKELKKELSPPLITYKEVEDAVLKFIRTTEYKRPVYEIITNKEILGNILTSLVRQTVNTVTGSAAGVLNRARSLVGLPTKVAKSPPEPATRKQHQKIISPLGYKFKVNKISHNPEYKIKRVNINRVFKNLNVNFETLRINSLKEKQTKVFVYEGLKILGISDITLSYDGGPLEYTVNFAVDRINDIGAGEIVSQNYRNYTS